MDNAGDHNGGGVPCIIQGYNTCLHVCALIILICCGNAAGMFTYYCPLAAMLWWVLLTVAVFEVGLPFLSLGVFFLPGKS